MVAWIALIVSSISLGYSVWNEVTKRRLQYAARFMLDWPESDHFGADANEPALLKMENVGAGAAHNVLLTLELDPAGVAYGSFSWGKVAPGDVVERMPDAKLPESLELIVAQQSLAQRTRWWRRKVLFATVRWETPFGAQRKQRYHVKKRSLHF